MDMQYDSSDGGQTLTLSGEMTIYSAEQTAASIFANEDLAGTALQIDMAGVTELDTAGLQILLMLRKQLGEQGSIAISPGNPVAASVISQFQLAAYLGMENP